MSEFFNSEIVQEGLREINRLQEEIYKNAVEFPSLDDDDKLYHVEMLEDLLEKQRLMYTRLSLSDDLEAVKLKEQLKESVQMLGFPAETDVQMLFQNMKETIARLRQQVDR